MQLPFRWDFLQIRLSAILNEINNISTLYDRCTVTKEASRHKYPLLAVHLSTIGNASNPLIRLMKAISQI